MLSLDSYLMKIKSRSMDETSIKGAVRSALETLTNPRNIEDIALAVTLIKGVGTLPYEIDKLLHLHSVISKCERDIIIEINKKPRARSEDSTILLHGALKEFNIEVDLLAIKCLTRLI